MSLSSAINASLSGLQANSLRADIVASNIANANTPGYVRRSLLLAESLVGGSTNGVGSDGLARAMDPAATLERRHLSSDLSQAGVLSSTWQTLSTRIGDSVEGSGLFQTFADFETALSAAAVTPESTATLDKLLKSASGITRELQELSSLVGSLRAEADRSIMESVGDINGALSKIEALNTKIAGSSRDEHGRAALLDERGRVLDQLAEHLPIRTIAREHDMIDVITAEGVYLLAGTAREVEFTPSNSFGPSASIQSGNLSSLTVEGTDITPGSASYGATSSGLLGALFTLRDQDLPEFGARLDGVAADLVGRFSDSAVDPTLAAGANGLFDDPSAAGTTGLAGRISINAAADPDQGGELSRLRDGIGAVAAGPPGSSVVLENMLASFRRVAPVNQGALQGNFNSIELAAHLSSITGQQRVHRDSVHSSLKAQFTAASRAEQSASGVDTDQQMQELLLIEEAYSANARVIEIARQMMDQLLEL